MTIDFKNLTLASQELHAVLTETKYQAERNDHDLGVITEKFLAAAGVFIREHHPRLADAEAPIRYEDFVWEASNLSSLLRRYGDKAGPYIVAPIYRIAGLLIDSGLTGQKDIGLFARPAQRPPDIIETR